MWKQYPVHNKTVKMSPSLLTCNQRSRNSAPKGTPAARQAPVGYSSRTSGTVVFTSRCQPKPAFVSPLQRMFSSIPRQPAPCLIIPPPSSP